MESSVPQLLPLLKRYFGFTSFRPLQEEIIRDALAGKDVFALLPTGGGKSLCFQLPAMVRPGLALFALAAFVVAEDLALARLDPRAVWEGSGLPGAGPPAPQACALPPGVRYGSTARQADLQACPACGLVLSLAQLLLRFLYPDRAKEPLLVDHTHHA